MEREFSGGEINDRDSCDPCQLLNIGFKNMKPASRCSRYRELGRCFRRVFQF